MIPNIGDSIKLDIHNWPPTSGKLTDVYGTPPKCILCRETMVRLKDKDNNEYAHTYCNNYRCPESPNFFKYLMGEKEEN